MNTSGYSRTPLTKKLSIKEGFTLQIINEPEGYYALFKDLPVDLSFTKDSKLKKDFIHYFTKGANELKKDFPQLKQGLVQNGMLWVSWPKKASQVVTDVDENIIREIGLKNGLVDIKVCAVNDIWSGLKFVIPVKDRV